MHIGQITKHTIPSLKAFDFQIKHTETDRQSHHYEIDLHSHREFEIYINISGDVSFLVKNNLYHLSRGDVIVARPGELHHCVYRSDAPHKFFWILFDCQKNSGLLDFLTEGFFENYISPQSNLREELLTLCYTLHGGDLTEEDKIYHFFRLFAILKKSLKPMASDSLLPQSIGKIIDYIDSHIHEEISISDIAKTLYISQSTLTRQFKKYLDITPLEFVKRRKLALAAQLLQEGKSVLAAGAGVGYNDSSYFIELFKKYYGTSPYQYKKNHQKAAP